MVSVYDRQNQVIVEMPEYKSSWLKKLYGTKYGSLLRPIIVSSVFSEVMTVFDRLPRSKKKIRDFIETYQIDMREFEKKDYPHFASFFERAIRSSYRPLCDDKAVLAVADAKLQVFEVTSDLQVTVKGQSYFLVELLSDVELAQAFSGGYLFLYRLGVEDCHQYLVAESGEVVCQKYLSGKLHSIREIVQRQLPVFKENKRVWTLIETDFGSVVQMEVGALLVGAIHNKQTKYVKRGQLKGHFSLGGSSILVFYPAGTVEVDQDIMAYSKKGIETQVKMGERIGEKKCYNA